MKSAETDFEIYTSGIKAKTHDDKEFYFYTEVQSDVENAMVLMGYDTHGYWLSEFKDRPEPVTPEKSDFLKDPSK